MATATTGANGSYSLSVDDGLGKVRVEFGPFPAGYQPGPHGADSGTTIQFVDVSDATADTNVSVGALVPEDYCENNPLIATCVYALGTAANANEPAVTAFRYNPNTNDLSKPPGDVNGETVATQAQVGTVYGEAFDPATGDLYAGAFMKRHAKFGPGGPGAIYRIPAGSGDAFGTPTVFATIPNAGLDPHTNGTDLASWAHDNDATTFNAVGKRSLGDVLITPDGRFLFAVNLNDNKLYKVTMATGNVNGGVAIPVPTGCTTSDWHPFGLGEHRGTVYVGGVCSKQSDQIKDANFKATVVPYNVDTDTFTPATSLAFALNYTRKCGDRATNPLAEGGSGSDPSNLKSACPTQPADWNPWIDSAGVATNPNVFDEAPYNTYPEPELSDVTFDGNDMVIGLRDRFADQMGNITFTPDGTTLRGAISAGDMLRACSTGATTWGLESNGTCGTRTAGAGGPGNNEGPGNGSFYFADDAYAQDHTWMGGVAQVAGYRDVMGTEMDPFPQRTENFDNGIQWASDTNGTRTRVTRIQDGSSDPQTVGFGKANGLGDLEARCKFAPIEIGNRVWRDTDSDGVQDADEPPIAGVTVQLLQGGTVVATTTTGADGTYYFPAQPNTDYQIRIDSTQSALTGLTVTQADAGADDRVDNDGTTSGANVVDNITTGGPGVNDHTFDFGFRAAVYDLALRKTTDQSEVAAGDLVTFKIEVFNQATDPQSIAKNITLSDYLPNGLEFSKADEPNWDDAGNGRLTRTIAGPLAPGDSTVVTIRLRVSKNAPDGDIVNFSEISRFEDLNGGTPPDVDSTPDSNPDNDGQVTDNAINNENGDEDDHDPAPVHIVRYDLALRKTTTANIVSPGEIVPFTITVFNQGTKATKNITVTDYIPAGLEFVSEPNPDWTNNGDGTVKRTIAGPLNPGQSTAVTINLRVAANATGVITNLSEISRFEDLNGGTPPDVDSTPDANPGNDGPITDDAINNENGDEDDHDPAPVRVVTYDLALRKTTTATKVKPGDVVDYTIEVFNQAKDPLAVAKDIEVIDGRHTGLTFVPSLNPTWKLRADGSASTTIAGPLAPGASTKVTIKLRVAATATGNRLDNYAEICSFHDTNGTPRPDVDSVPDCNLSNDKLVDDVIDNRGGDEDDHDIASVTLSKSGKLAVKKTASSKSAMQKGHVGTWKIVVRNSGQTTQTSVKACDRLPKTLGYVSSSPKATVRNGVPCWNLGTMKPGASKTITIKTTFLSCSTQTNKVTVSSATNSASSSASRKVSRKSCVSPANGVTG